MPGGVRTRTLTDILRKPNGDIDNLSSDPFRCVKFVFLLNFSLEFKFMYEIDCGYHEKSKRYYLACQKESKHLYSINPAI